MTVENVQFKGLGLWQAATERTVPSAALSPEIVGFRSRDERSRPFNLLRSQIAKLAGEDVRLVGVTSATPQVGKTFVACNLAAALSRLPDVRVVLLDLDLRRGSVAERFGIEPDVGLSDYLAGSVGNLRDLAWRVEGQELVVYPTRQLKLDSAELLSGARFQSMVSDIRRAGRPLIVVCDLPPVFANDDAMVINESVDGYLFVIENGYTTSKHVKDATRLLGPERCFGTVLNRFAGGLGGDSYGFGYGGRGSYSNYFG